MEEDTTTGGTSSNRTVFTDILAMVDNSVNNVSEAIDAIGTVILTDPNCVWPEDIAINTLLGFLTVWSPDSAYWSMVLYQGEAAYNDFKKNCALNNAIAIPDKYISHLLDLESPTATTIAGYLLKQNPVPDLIRGDELILKGARDGSIIGKYLASKAAFAKDRSVFYSTSSEYFIFLTNAAISGHCGALTYVFDLCLAGNRLFGLNGLDSLVSEYKYSPNAAAALYNVGKRYANGNVLKNNPKDVNIAMATKIHTVAAGEPFNYGKSASALAALPGMSAEDVLKWNLMAATLDDPAGLRGLGDCYMTGKGYTGPVDYVKAIWCFKKALEFGGFDYYKNYSVALSKFADTIPVGGNVAERIQAVLNDTAVEYLVVPTTPM